MSTTAISPDDVVPDAELEAAMPAPSLRRIALASVFSLVVGMGGLLGWAAATPIERAVVANGALVAEGRRKTIQLLEPGLLRELLVREGERVAAGQPLLRLDVTQADALANQARVQRWTAAARLARLRAEQQDLREMELPEALLTAAAAEPMIATLLADEQRLFAARWLALDGQLAVQEARLAQLQEQLAAAQAQRAAFATRLRATREELAGVNQLLARGFATRTRQLELQRAEAEFLGSMGQFAAQEAQTRQAIAQAELERGTLMLNRRSEVSRDLQDAQAQLADATERLRAAEDLLARREVVAPEDGIVTDIRFVTPGSSIGAGQPVLDLVPLDDRLVVETQIALTDIEQVHVGSRVNVRLTAFRQRETPLIEGRISYVAADRQQDQRGASFFVVRAELDADSLAAARGVQLAPGMPAETFILGERRSALDYLVRPVQDSLRRAMRD
ncbi:HlyD family type I secretion periplasmic adaptor subunit [Falsiroseomonas oryzae]|uniref:HlyD family type I secretion periplasmic adaptor subunit n=1 Tax=Falsiroseomonas oryzae TaxID=2766473 RepID=UPI0022EB59B1|nr:HlyD family type I secretion periplasmic adaptor subunit [Roseomonas sp. MO-31]